MESWTENKQQCHISRDDGDLFLSRQSLTNPQRLWIGKTDLVHEQSDTEACKAVSFVARPLTVVAHLCRETFAAEGWQGGHWAGWESEQHPSDTCSPQSWIALVSNSTERLCLDLRVTAGNVLLQCKSSARVVEFYTSEAASVYPVQPSRGWVPQGVCVWWALGWLPRLRSRRRCSPWWPHHWGHGAFVTVLVVLAGRNSPSNGAETSQVGRTCYG